MGTGSKGGGRRSERTRESERRRPGMSINRYAQVPKRARRFSILASAPLVISGPANRITHRSGAPGGGEEGWPSVDSLGEWHLGWGRRSFISGGFSCMWVCGPPSTHGGQLSKTNNKVGHSREGRAEATAQKSLVIARELMSLSVCWTCSGGALGCHGSHGSHGRHTYYLPWVISGVDDWPSRLIKRDCPLGRYLLPTHTWGTHPSSIVVVFCFPPFPLGWDRRDSHFLNDRPQPHTARPASDSLVRRSTQGIFRRQSLRLPGDLPRGACTPGKSR